MRTALVKLTVLNLPPISAAEFSENPKPNPLKISQFYLGGKRSDCRAEFREVEFVAVEFYRAEFCRASEPCGKDERVFLAPSKQAPSKRR